MKHRSRTTALVGLVLAAGVALYLQMDASDRVFTVAQVQRGLARQPGQWINRTVRVRGVFRYTMSDAGVIDIFHPPPYILVSYALYQPGPTRTGGVSGAPLVLKLAPHLTAPHANPLAAFVRQIPWLQGLIGNPRADTTIFRLTLLSPPRGACPAQECPAAQLDDQPW